MKSKVILFTAALILGSTSYVLSQITLTYTFAPSTTIRSAEVNSNFSALSTKALDRTGGTITGNIAVDSSITVDGLDLSAAVANKASTATIAGVWTFSANPVIAAITNTGLLTLPTSTDTLVGRATTDTLTNKTLTAPVTTGTVTLNTIAYTWPGSQTANYYLKTNGSGTLSWAAVTSTKPFRVFRPANNEPPTAAYATLDTRNAHPTLDFDGATDEEAVFSDVLPVEYGGGGLTVEVWVAFTSATSGSGRFQAGLERVDVSTLDIDADSFAAFQSCGVTAPGTSGQTVKCSVTFTDGAQMDSVAAGEAFRLKIRRDADGTSGTDDITTDAEVVRVVLRES